jgi:hypothetical protein
MRIPAASDNIHKLPSKGAARDTYTEISLEANSIPIPDTEIVRTIFGRTFPEYKQFISRASKSEEDEIDKESNTCEE